MTIEQAQAAACLIVETCPVAGGLRGNERLFDFLDELATHMEAGATASELFGSRHRQHVIYAIRMITRSAPLDSPSVLASVFLGTRFELYFRLLSGRLGADGSWLDEAAKTSAFTELEDPKLKRKYLADVELTYRVMLMNAASPVVRTLIELEAMLAPSRPPWDDTNEFSYRNLGGRIKVMRDPVSHGFYSDPSAEGFFYALMTGIVYYGSA